MRHEELADEGSLESATLRSGPTDHGNGPGGREILRSLLESDQLRYECQALHGSPSPAGRVCCVLVPVVGNEVGLAIELDFYVGA